jgi:hypothetical protein
MSDTENLLSDTDLEKSLITRSQIPPFIEQINKKYIFLCCCKFSIKNIKDHHIVTYNELKQEALIKYDENDIKHETSLKLFYISALKHEPEQDIISSDWRTLGFQVIII